MWQDCKKQFWLWNNLNQHFNNLNIRIVFNGSLPISKYTIPVLYSSLDLIRNKSKSIFSILFAAIMIRISQTYFNILAILALKIDSIVSIDLFLTLKRNGYSLLLRQMFMCAVKLKSFHSGPKPQTMRQRINFSAFLPLFFCHIWQPVWYIFIFLRLF